MQAIGRQPHRVPGGAPVHYERHRPEQTTLYRLVQQHARDLLRRDRSCGRAAGADLPQFVKEFVKDEFDAFLERGIPAHSFLRLRCGDCGHDKLVAFSCKRRGSLPVVRRPSCDAAIKMRGVPWGWSAPRPSKGLWNPNTRGWHSEERWRSIALIKMCPDRVSLQPTRPSGNPLVLAVIHL